MACCKPQNLPPTFNISCGILTNPGFWPPFGPLPPFRLTSSCRLSNGIGGPWMHFSIDSAAPLEMSTAILLLPAGTDIRDGMSAGSWDFVECPTGSQRWYRVMAFDDANKGFTNEFRWAFLQKQVDPVLASWPTPAP